MRISGGDARGIKLKVPKGIRPASERVRQAIFSSLAHRVLDARVLDLYAGSGAYGLDALSRGASSAVFVDTDTGACRANVTAAGFASEAKVRTTTAERYLSRTASSDGPFDLVFADPPYARAALDRGVLDALAGVLAQDGRVVWESRWRDEAPELPDGWLLEADRRYGDTRVTTLTRGATG
jgi:16S rRNA (guanine(966)-N(2))-methyltransferase RsmD